MAAIFTKSTLLITLTALCFFLPPPPFLAATANVETPLAIQVCKNTTFFNFCRQSIYSDPRAATADRVTLAYISFSNAYLNATDTRDYIASQIKPKSRGGGNRNDVVRRGLKSCLANYEEAASATVEVLRNLDDESYYDFDKVSLDLDSNSSACERGFNKRSPLTKRNKIMTKLAEICYVVSKFFPYSD